MNRRVQIVMTGPKTGKVWVDGVEQPELVEVHFSVDVEMDKPASVVLVRRVYGTIEIDGEMDVTCLDNKGAKEWAGEPKMPVMPPCRVSYEGLGGQLMFSSQEELDKWKAEPFWKKVLGLTEYDKRLRS